MTISLKKLRVAHLVTHPIQYYAPLYREIAARNEIELTVYFFSDFSINSFRDSDFGKEIDWGADLLKGYKYHFSKSALGKPHAKLKNTVNFDLIYNLFRNRPDAIWVMSYASINAILVRMLALVFRIPVFFRDDTNLLRIRPLWLRIFKHILLRPLLWRSWGLYVGEQSKRYWINYGVPEHRLVFSPHCVDNDYFHDAYRQHLPNRDEIRRKLGINDDSPVILFCGKFNSNKQPLMILEAYIKVSAIKKCWLLMVGDGPLSAKIQQIIQAQGVTGVIMTGFMNQTDITLAYTAADFLVMCSRTETWGLVINEAMNFSLPIVASDQIGSAEDLLKDKWNGLLFKHNNLDSLVQSLFELISSKELRNIYGNRSKDLIGRYSPSISANGVINATIMSYFSIKNH